MMKILHLQVMKAEEDYEGSNTLVPLNWLQIICDKDCSETASVGEGGWILEFAHIFSPLAQKL